MKFILIISLLMLLFVLNACDRNKEQSVSDNFKNIEVVEMKAMAESEEKMEFADTTTYYQQQPLAPSPRQQAPIKQIDWDKKIVKNATLNAEVKNYASSSKALKDKIKKYGGYISQEQENTSDYKIENTVVIKVPVDQFDNVVADLLLEAATINTKQISSEDVTTEFVDGKSRLEAKKQVRLKYLDLLQRAKNMSEILEVQNEINDIREQIEVVSGRINYLSHSSAMSTINLTYFQVLNSSAKNNGEANFFSRLKTSFETGWYWIGELCVAIIAFWPFLLILLLGVFFYRRRILLKIK